MYISDGTIKRIVRTGDNWVENNNIDIANLLDFDYSVDRRGNQMFYWIIDKVRKVQHGQREKVNNYFFDITFINLYAMHNINKIQKTI